MHGCCTLVPSIRGWTWIKSCCLGWANINWWEESTQQCHESSVNWNHILLGKPQFIGECIYRRTLTWVQTLTCEGPSTQFCPGKVKADEGKPIVFALCLLFQGEDLFPFAQWQLCHYNHNLYGWRQCFWKWSPENKGWTLTGEVLCVAVTTERGVKR